VGDVVGDGLLRVAAPEQAEADGERGEQGDCGHHRCHRGPAGGGDPGDRPVGRGSRDGNAGVAERGHQAGPEIARQGHQGDRGEQGGGREHGGS
jgi:hypothetical protein